MAFNFEQYNSASLTQRSGASKEHQDIQIVPSGYVQIKKDHESEIFQKNKMKINLPANINFLSVANDWLVVLMSNQILFKLNLKQPDKQSEVNLEKFITGLKVSKMFLDPTGNHLFLSLLPKSSGYSAELMYLNKSNNKPKIISKVKINFYFFHYFYGRKFFQFRDHEITAIGFNYENTSEINTGNILLGTSKGLIFEADIGSDGDRLINNNWKQVKLFKSFYIIARYLII